MTLYIIYFSNEGVYRFTRSFTWNLLCIFLKQLDKIRIVKIQWITSNNNKLLTNFQQHLKHLNWIKTKLTRINDK